MQPTVDSAPQPGSPSASGRSVTLIVAAVIVLMVLLGLAAVLWLTADRRYDDNVADFARAPSGCDTTLDFDRSGTFTVYMETTGELPSLAGDCGAVEVYDRDADDQPTVQLELRTIDGDLVAVVDADGPSYDTGTFAGIGVGRVEVLEPGDHVITVDGDGGPAFAVAVGGSPDDGVALLRWGAAAAAIVGLVAAGALFVIAGRRPEPAPDPVRATTPGWPTSPPGFPAPPPTTGASGPALPTPIPGQPPLAGAGRPVSAPSTGSDADDTSGDADGPPSPWAPPTA